MVLESGSSPGGRFLESYTADVPAADGASIRRHDLPLMGTWNTLLLVHRPGQGLGRTELDAAAAGALQLMTRLEEELSRFQPESEVSLMNALAAAEPVHVSENLYELLRLSRRFWEITGGAFDPTVGPLMAAWGFDGREGRVPPEAEIQALLRVCGMNRVWLDDRARTVRFERAGVSVDLGAIGKGFVIDRAVRHLRSAGVDSGALISGRSTIVVWGAPPAEERWEVAVANPLDPDDVLLEIAPAAGAISSSAAYERRLRIEGRDYGHVLDPRIGRPVDTCLGTTAWTPDALVGDVVSTALFVLGPDAGRAVLPEFGRVTALVLVEDSSAWGGLGQTLLTSGEPGFRLEGLGA